MSTKKQQLEPGQSMLDIGTTAPGANGRSFLDLGPETTNIDTVIEASTPGEQGDDITIEFVADGVGAGTLDESAYPDIVFHFDDATTTVTDFENAVDASTYLTVKTAGTGANIFDNTDDVLAPTNLAGGFAPGIQLSEGHFGMMRPGRYLVTAVVTGGASDLYIYGRVAVGDSDQSDDRWGLHNDARGRILNGKLGTALATGTHHFIVEDIGLYGAVFFTKSANSVDVYVHPISSSHYGS